MPRRAAISENAVTVTFRVRYFETDQMKVAHHAHYLAWFEMARAAFCRARGVDYGAMEIQGLFLPIVEAHCRYVAPARYDEELTIAAEVAERSSRSVRFRYLVTRDGKRIAEGETVNMLVDDSGRPRLWPDAIARKFDGEPPAGGA